MVHENFKSWFMSNLNNRLLENGYSLKFISEEGDDFGNLEGVQIESAKKGGHIYFWSFGMFNYHFYDFEKEVDLVKDTFEEYDNEEFRELLSEILIHI